MGHCINFSFYLGLFTNSVYLCNIEGKEYTCGEVVQTCKYLATLLSAIVKESGSGHYHQRAFPVCSDSRESACNAGDQGSIPGREDPLQKGMATHAGITAWIIPWSEEPGGLRFMDCKESDTTERLTLFYLLTFSAILYFFPVRPPAPCTGQNVEFNDILKNQLLLKINTSFRLVFLLIRCP